MAKATLTTLTPVHIGNGISYNRNIDFIRKDKKIGIIDEKKILDLIGVENINQWVNSIDKSTPLLEFLEKGRGLKIDSLDKISHRICNLKNHSDATQLKEQYYSAIKGVCIPGSSIKGAIKTAIWETLSDETFLKTLSANDLKDFKGKWSDKTIDKKLFGRDATEKSTRFLKVGDVYFGNLETDVHEMRVLNKKEPEWKFKEGSMLFETIPAATSASFEMKVDSTLMAINLLKNPTTWAATNTTVLKDLNSLCSMVNDFTKAIVKWDIEELDDEDLGDHDDILIDYRRVLRQLNNIGANEMILRVGANNGWKFTTGGWITKTGFDIGTNEEKLIRKSIQKNKEYPEKMIWPKTRKITTDNKLFGFVKIKFEE